MEPNNVKNDLETKTNTTENKLQQKLIFFSEDTVQKIVCGGISEYSI